MAGEFGAKAGNRVGNSPRMVVDSLGSYSKFSVFEAIFISLGEPSLR